MGATARGASRSGREAGFNQDDIYWFHDNFEGYNAIATALVAIVHRELEHKNARERLAVPIRGDMGCT